MAAQAHRAGEDRIAFYLVHVADAAGSHVAGRYVRTGARFDDADPWVKVMGWPGRDPQVHRFETMGSALVWSKARFALKRTMCRVLKTSGPMREGDAAGAFVPAELAPADAKRSPRGRSRNTLRVSPKR